MIPTNLKVGDTFVDGGYTYKITKVSDNPYYKYESERLDVKKVEVKVEVKPEVKPEVKEEVKEEKKYTKTDINRMSGANLEKMCEELGLEKGFGGEMKKAIIEKLGL